MPITALLGMSNHVTVCCLESIIRVELAQLAVMMKWLIQTITKKKDMTLVTIMILATQYIIKMNALKRVRTTSKASIIISYAFAPSLGSLLWLPLLKWPRVIYTLKTKSGVTK
jgi:hypothetical protein